MPATKASRSYAPAGAQTLDDGFLLLEIQIASLSPRTFKFHRVHKLFLERYLRFLDY